MTVRSAPAYLVRGDDPVVLADAVTALVDELVGDADRGLMVEELSGEEYELAALVDAAQTPPFLTDRRVVVGRDVDRFASAEAVAPLVRYLEDPLATTSLVLVWPRGRVPPPLLRAVEGAGEQVDAGVGPKRQAWTEAQLKDAAVHLDAEARAAVAAHLGEDVSRLAALVATLESAFGPGARVARDDVEPFLGEAGSVPPWELTDAIDRGDIPAALDRLHRTLSAGERHSLQVMATITGHYSRMVRLDGAGAANERAAAELLGMKRSTYPAGKALRQGRRLGHDGLRRAVTLLAKADLDLRGATAWPPELVMEVLVARLARLSGPPNR